MKYLLVSLVSLSFSLVAVAHDTTHVSNAMAKIFIEPVSIADVYNGPNLRFGAEVPLSRAQSAIGTVGIYSQGYYCKGGVKSYWRGRNKEVFYLEADGFYKNTVHNTLDNVRRYDTGSYEAKPGADFRYNVGKQVYGFNVEFGYDMLLGHRGHWAAEWFGGLGVRFRSVTPAISDSMQNDLYHYHESMIEHQTNTRTTDATTVSLVAGVRVGYCFRRRR